MVDLFISVESERAERQEMIWWIILVRSQVAGEARRRNEKAHRSGLWSGVGGIRTLVQRRKSWAVYMLSSIFQSYQQAGERTTYLLASR